MTIFLLIVGLALLVLGAEVLVKGASNLAAAAGIPPLVIGLTIVAFGTSAPELAVSVASTYSGQADIAVGNVVGSNIFNILFILGLSALIAPLRVSAQLVRFDVPLMIGISLLLYVISLDGSLSRIDGLILFCGILAYTGMLFRGAKKKKGAKVLEQGAEVLTPREPSSTVVNIARVLGGLFLLVLGSRWLVNGAVEIARYFGVSELIIGLTIVAAGTSLPEVATSVIATLRGERDIAVGNVVGSNIFNILAVLGVMSLVAPDVVTIKEEALSFDYPVMIAAAIACLPIFFTGFTIARWEGALFLGYYIAYTTYLVLSARHPQILSDFNAAMVWFALPLTAITLIVVTLREVKAKRVTA